MASVVSAAAWVAPRAAIWPVLGALVMQSLESGMVLLGLDTPLQNIVVGLVLVAAVWLDRLYRSRTLKGGAL